MLRDISLRIISEENFITQRLIFHNLRVCIPCVLFNLIAFFDLTELPWMLVYVNRWRDRETEWMKHVSFRPSVSLFQFSVTCLSGFNQKKPKMILTKSIIQWICCCFLSKVGVYGQLCFRKIKEASVTNSRYPHWASHSQSHLCQILTFCLLFPLAAPSSQHWNLQQWHLLSYTKIILILVNKN